MSRAKSNFLDYLVQNFSLDKGESLNKQLKKLFIEDKENLQHRLLAIQKIVEKNPESDLAKNGVISKLIGIPKASPTDPHNIEIEAKPTTVNAKDDFTSSLEELNDHSGIIDPETKQPIDIKQFVQDLYKFGLLQSGIRKNRISFNDLVPSQDYIKYVQQGIAALEDNNAMIQRYDDLKVFWRTNWKDDNIVPKEYKRPIQILDSGEKFISLSSYRADSPVIKVVKPLQVKDKTTGKMREMTKPEIAERKNLNRGENLYETRLFQKVTYPDGSPYEKLNGEYVNHIYKEINAWGDGNFMQEHYTEAQPSILDKNIKIDELSHEEFIDKYEKDSHTTISTGEPDESIDTESEDDTNEADLAQAAQYEVEEQARQEQPSKVDMRDEGEVPDDYSEGEAMPDTKEEWAEYMKKHPYLPGEKDDPLDQPDSSPCPF